MRKGIKILGKVFSAAVLLLIIVPVALSLLLDIPAVQNYAVHRAARFVSRKLETTVSIDRVDIGIFSKVRVKGFYVEDYQRDTLLYVGKLDAFITSFGIFGGGLELSRGEIADARLYLRQTPGGEMNIKQIVDRISDPDKPKKGNFRLSLKKASIENMDLCLERLDHRDPEHGIDFSHMHLYGITARVDDFTIDGQAIYTSIAAFSARERSGFVLNHLAGRFYMTQGCLGFENASIITPRSNVNFPFVSLAGDSWAQYKDFIGEVRIDASMRNTTVSTDDIAFFAPKLRDWHVDFTDVNVEVAGVVSDFTGRIRSMQIGEGTTLVADASVKGLPDIRKTRFDLSVPRLRSTARAVDELALGIAGRKLSDKLVGVLGNSGQIDLNARFRGLLSSFDMQLGAATGVGNVSCNLKMAPVKGGLSSVRGDVETRNLRLGELLDRRDLLGNATLTAYVDGVIGRGVADANVVGNVTQLGFNGYVYDSLRLDGRLRNREFDGRITARDPNLDFDFFGTVDLNDSVPRYDFTMDLRHADLARLHVNRRDSVSQLSGRIVAAAGGRSLDDLNGRIQVTDARYRYNDKEIAAASMTVTGENSERSKFVELRSDFADVTFRSKTSYRTVFEYLRRSAWKYLPMLGGEKWEETPSERKAAVANDFSLLSVNIRNFNPVADAVSTGLQIADGSSLQLLFNPASDQLSLKAASEYIERRRMLATRLSVNASNRGDSLAVYASAEDLYAGVLHLPRLSLTGGARQNRVQLSAGFDDTLRRVSGLVGFRAAVADEHGPNGRVVDLRILPSHITRGDKTWQIFARKILLDTAQVVIDKFYVMNREQELLLDGVASRSREDSVTLSLHNFDLAPFAQVAERMGYYIEGRTNGSAAMKSVLRGGEITADILLDSVEVNDIPAPPMRLASRWDFARSRAGVTVSDRIRRDTLIRGFYAPDRNRYFARLDVDSLDMALLDPILAGVVSSTEGMASAGLTLQGQGRKADLEGEIRVAGLKTTVDFTQVTYSMPEAVLNVKNNRFRASNVPIFDPRGNRGRFDFDMNLQHLSNISYDVRVAPRQMLVLDTDSDDNDMFYGRVFATGRATVAGDKGSVRMDIVATTDDDSAFFLPLSSKSNVARADFITFETPQQKADTLNILERKKLMFERKHKPKAIEGNSMDIDMTLNVRPNADFQLVIDPTVGDIIKGRGEGTLNLHINPRSNVFEMYGDYTITEGSYLFTLQNIINKRFIIENGSTIQWTGEPLDARLNINAVYKLKTSLQPLIGTSVSSGGGDMNLNRAVPVECIINLSDRLTHPTVTFDVKVPTADAEYQTIIANTLNTQSAIAEQFMFLLVTNSFHSDTSGGGNNLGAAASAATGFELLSNQLSNWLSTDDYNIVFRYRPKSELSGDEVDFGFSKSLINNRLFVEVEGNYMLDNSQAVNKQMSNFMGEAYVTWLIDRAGTLKLKGFTQTIDRFDENQGLQETGIGIYYKEDFNNLKDLKERLKNKFRSRRKRQQLLERRRAADSVRRASPADTVSSASVKKDKNLNK